MAGGQGTIEPGDASPEDSEPEPQPRASRLWCLAFVLLALCLGGGLWLFQTLNPTHAQNGSRVLKHEDFGDVVNVRFSEGELQVIAADGRVWLEREPGVLGPLSSLPLGDQYFPQTSISGDYVALPAGLELHVLDTITNRILKIPGAGASAGASQGDLVAGSWHWQDGVSVFSAKDGVELWEDKRARGGGSPVLAFGGPLLAVGGKDSQVLVYEAKTGEVVRSLSCRGKAVYALAFSRDGSQLAFADPLGVLLWSVRDWKPAPEVPCPNVTRLAFSEDGARLAVGDSSGKLEIWDLAGARLQVFEHDDSAALPADSVRGIAFDGGRVAWSVRDQVYVANLEGSEGH